MIGWEATYVELLYLSPPRSGLRLSGIYVLDDEGERVLAGPFMSPRDAVRWIEMTAPARQEATKRSEAASPPG